MFHTMISSSKFMKFMLSSQITSVKHRMKELVIKFEPLNQTIGQFLQDFLESFMIQVFKKKIRVKIDFLNQIPCNMHSDW